MSLPKSFVMWGERGLVATFLLDLYRVPDNEGWRLFSEYCGLPGFPFTPTSIRGVTVVIEPDFGNDGFGHPDAIVKLDLDSDNTVVVILEAKRLPYDKSSLSPSNRGGAGYNSKFNGQLELNHCLALALSDFKPGKVELSEPEWILHTPYGIERRSKLRTVKNPAVLEEIVLPFSGLPFKSYFHMLITTDVSNPLTNQENRPIWPELYHTDYPFKNCWEQFKSQYSWISWEQVRGLVERLNSENSLMEGSLFLPTLEKNRKNFKSGLGVSPTYESDSLAEDSSADEVEEKSPLIMPPQLAPSLLRGTRGASMIYAPEINSKTFLHFSWKNESCAIRDYSKGPNIMPPEDRTLKKSEVERRIKKEITIRNRESISDTRFWFETTINLNRIELPNLTQN